MTAKTFYPTTHLFPHQPQLLHQMVLRLFLLAEEEGQAFPTDGMAKAIIMPYGSYFDVGLIQATGYRYRLGFHKPKKVVLISSAALDANDDFIGCTYDALHTFFSELKVDHSLYSSLRIPADDALFAKHADPIVCQLPFLRSYQKIDSITPIIVNNKKTDLDRERFWSALWDNSGDTCYVFCTNLLDNMLTSASISYEKITGEQLVAFAPNRKTS